MPFMSVKTLHILAKIANLLDKNGKMPEPDAIIFDIYL